VFREIIDRFCEGFRFHFLPFFECLYRGDMTECLLGDLVVIEADIAIKGGPELF